MGELNARLAPWYYVISNEVYKKIHLDRKDFVKTSEPIKPTSENAPPPSEVRASHVLVSYKGSSKPTPSITRTKEEAKSRAETLRKQIVKEGKEV